jgi:hypothetical protein
MSLGSGASGAAKGAGTGAAIGSFVPGIGTAIGAGIGGGIGFFKGLFGGDDDDEDEKKFDPDKTALTTIEGLQAQSKQNKARGDELGTQSSAALNPVLNYFKALASGDPSALMAATAPERGRVIDQYDAARKAAVVSAPRGGGTTSAIVNSYITEANQLSDITASAHRDANTQLGQLGINLAGLGLSADQLASADLDSILQAVFAQKNIDAQKRGQNMGMLGDVGESIGTLIGILATKGGG